MRFGGDWFLYELLLLSVSSILVSFRVFWAFQSDFWVLILLPLASPLYSNVPSYRDIPEEMPSLFQSYGGALTKLSTELASSEG